eukprot:snap_masked-scaffold_3-processed-gene-21.47-mRNA-1 protein AED:1.00 eAED:1.00 QI:0/-1/0/0/-1/1/1/0/77
MSLPEKIPEATAVPVQETPVQVAPVQQQYLLQQQYAGPITWVLIILCCFAIGPLALFFLCCPIDQRPVVFSPQGQRV